MALHPSNPVLVAPNDQWVVFSIARESIKRRELDQAIGTLRALVADHELIKQTAGTLCLTIDGYSGDSRELCEIPEVRAAFTALTERCPWWLHLVRLDHDEGLILWFTTRVPVVVHAAGNGQVAVELLDCDKLDGHIRAALIGAADLYCRHGMSESWTKQRLEAMQEAIHAAF